MAKRDYYIVLGVDRGASQKEIKTAYRKLARKLHPDVNPGSKDLETKFKEVNEAYEVLSDQANRKKYDQYGERWKQADQMAGAGAAAGGSPFGTYRTRPRTTTTDFGDLGNLFGGMFGRRAGRGGGRDGFAVPGQAIESPVEITLEEASNGSTRVLELAQDPEKPRRLEVKIPAGVKTGSRIRLTGQGGPGFGGGPPGDLWLNVAVQPHPQFQREGDDLRVEVPVSVADLALGAEIQISSLNGGKLLLNLPAETQNGQSFRLKGQGMPRLNTEARGDLYAKTKAVLPAGLTERERDLFKELKTLRGQ